MRKFYVQLPDSLLSDLSNIVQEIKKIGTNESDYENFIQKRHSILLIATFTEQTLKKYRNMIVEQENAGNYILKYFEKLNMKEPLYVNRNSGDSIFKMFGLDVNTYTLKRLVIKKQILFFDTAIEFEEFEKKININRNMAAHETFPNFTLEYSEIIKFFDYVLLFLEHYFEQLSSVFNLTISTDYIDSIGEYEEYFVSNNISKVVKDEVFIYRKKNNRRYKQIKETFSVEEWEIIFNMYLKMDDTEKLQNPLIKINHTGSTSEFQSKISQFCQPKSAWDGDGFNYRLLMINDLARAASDFRDIINYPLKIKGNKLRMGLETFD